VNPANLLTTSRFFLSFLVVYLVFLDGGVHTHWALLVFLLASLTDYWDGRLARRLNQKTVYGALMDPLADKALTLCAFLSFWKLDLVPGILVAIIATRDAVVTAFRLFYLGKGDPSAGTSGKHKTFIQMAYISGVLIYLALRQQPFWQLAWDEPALLGVRGGMLLVVGMVLWSGLEALRMRRRA